MRKKLFSLAIAIITLAPMLATGVGHAALPFTPNNIIDDAIFDNTNTMNATQIDSFLNSFPNSCISTNAGFSAPDVTGYSTTSNSFLFGANVSAGKIIDHAAEAYGINPQVLLTTLQKEQSLVTGSAGCHPNNPNPAWPVSSTPAANSTFTCTISGHSTTCTYACPDSFGGGCINIAVGYDCPYYCKTSSEGFSSQVVRAAWLLKFSEQRAKGNVNWDVQKTTTKDSAGNSWVSNWDNSNDPPTTYYGLMTQGTYARVQGGSTASYDGYGTVTDLSGNSVSVHMDTAATAALYDYTPFESGNQKFDDIFQDTFGFGSPYNQRFGASYSSESPYPILDSGTSTTVYFRFQNTGNAFWKDDQSTFPGYYPIHLATSAPINRGSPFASSNWLSGGRPTGTISAVYNSDGTPDPTGTSQHTVQPGEIGEFQFTIYANPNLPGGVYTEYFQPIIEGAPGYSWNMGSMVSLNIGVHVPSYQASYYSQSTYPTLAPGASSPAFMKFKNTGASPWYDDSAIWPGKQAIHLAASSPINRGSSFAASSWPSASRPGVNFTKVYEGDGVTLASNQHVVQPGEIAEYDFTLQAPSSAQPGFYKEYFMPIVEGAPGNSWNMGSEAWLGITVQ